MIGVQPMLGRQIREDEDAPGGPRVVLLSHGVWQRRYAGDPSIIGRAITVNGNAAHRHRRDAAEVPVSRARAALDSADADRVRRPAHRPQPRT